VQADIRPAIGKEAGGPGDTGDTGTVNPRQRLEG